MTEDALSAAQATERELREQIADLVHARARAEAEAKRLTGRTAIAGADPTLADIARRWERQAGTLGEEIEGLRTSLRAAEAEVERLRVEEAGA